MGSSTGRRRSPRQLKRKLVNFESFWSVFNLTQHADDLLSRGVEVLVAVHVAAIDGVLLFVDAAPQGQAHRRVQEEQGAGG